MENMSSKMKKSNNVIDSDKRKPVMRRRSHARRRVPQDSVIDMAEARREIVHALHLHRSSASSSRTALSTATATTATSISSSATMLGNCYSNYHSSDKATVSSLSSSQCYCHSLTESMPLPEPIWSTTEPSIPAAAPSLAAAMEGLEFEWGENQASSYSWWLGFLKALDSKNNVVENYNSKYPSLERIHVMGNSKASCKLGIGEVPNSIGHDHQQNSSSLDEWLMFPTTDDHQNEIANFK